MGAELAVGAAGMNARQARLLIGPQDEAGILHAERREDPLPHVAVERQAAHALDRLAGPVDVDAVLPLLAGVGDHRHLQGLELAGADAGDVGHLHVALDVLVPQVVAEAGRVGQQVTQRDRPLGRPELGLALGIEALQHLRGAELHHDVADRLVETELALLDHLHGSDRGHRLGHRGDPEHRVRRHRCTAHEVALAEGAFVEDALVVGGERHDAGDIAGGDRAAQHGVYLRLVGAGLARPEQGYTRCQQSAGAGLDCGSACDCAGLVVLVVSHRPVLPLVIRDTSYAALSALPDNYSAHVEDERLFQHCNCLASKPAGRTRGAPCAWPPPRRAGRGSPTSW